MFLLWRRPLRVLRQAAPARRGLFVALGVLLAAMNAMFYLAVDRLPLSTVGAIEFLGVVVLALVGTRSGRNFAALALAVGGVAVLTDVRLAGEPLGFGDAGTAFVHPLWLLWGIGVGVCSSVIPYASDQLAMARLPRSVFAFLLALLPASSTVIGLAVLGQIPTWRDIIGVAAVIAGVAIRQERPDTS
ncbi:hypothetical protein AB0399_17820 [Streptomyces sp. NPDC088194]|uniref:EamA family transporter n=1 Tax=Streptomyces sp. NPDC088194 TaxID=3154931 RepID=UPI00344B665D